MKKYNLKRKGMAAAALTLAFGMFTPSVSFAAGRSGDNRGTAAGRRKTVASLLSGVSCIWFRRRNGTVLPERQGRDGIAYMIWNGASTNFHRRGE